MQSLAGFGLEGNSVIKPGAAIPGLRQGSAMTRKKIHREKIRSPLQETFVTRLNEEMEWAKLSDNELAKQCAKRGKPVGQTSISRITSGRQDPSLELVYAIANGLGISALILLVDASEVGKKITRYYSAPQQKVVELQSPYPKIFKDKPKKANAPQSHARRKRVGY